MNIEAYRQKLQNSLQAITTSETLTYYLAQINAKRLGARIAVQLNEHEIWSNLTALINHSTLLSRIDNPEDQTSINSAFKYAAQYFEYLSTTSDSYDRDFLKLLSALCFDISGYQANAQCIVRQLPPYEVGMEPLAEDVGAFSSKRSLTVTNQLLNISRLFLEKKIGAIPDIRIDRKSKWHCELSDSISAITDNILRGNRNDFLMKIEKAYVGSFDVGSYLDNLLLSLFLIRIQRYSNRSIWQNILTDARATEPSWNRYVRLKTNNTYENGRLVQPQNRQSRFELWESQLAAIKAGILNQEHGYVVQMPTSAGKTFICELVILDSLIKFPGTKCLYISPFKALSNQVEVELRKNFFGVGVRASTLSGGFDLDPFDEIIMSETDVLIATPEKVDLLLRTNLDIFNNLSSVIIDEGHLVGDATRGPLIELLLSKLKSKLPNVRIIFVSAVLPESNGAEFARWLCAGGENLIKAPIVDGKPWRPTSKLFSIFYWDNETGVLLFPEIEVAKDARGKPEFAFARGLVTKKQTKTFTPTGKERIKMFPYNPNDKGESTTAVGYDLASKGPTLIFTTRPDWVRSTGKRLVELINGIEANGGVVSPPFTRNENLLSAKATKEWFGADSIEYKMTVRGIGLHHGKLPDAVRRAVEEDFSSGNIKLLVANSSVSQGVNFPIKYLVVHSLVLGSDDDPTETISTRDFQNLIGRAGRAGKETEGNIVFIATGKHDLTAYNDFVEASKSDDVKSVYFHALKELVDERITEETFQEKVQTLSEPAILSMLVEESFGTTSEERISKLIDNSLFKIQILGDTAIQGSFEKLQNSFSGISTKFSELQLTEPVKISFAKTGLSIKSNTQLLAWIENNKDDIARDVAAVDHTALLTFILVQALSDELSEIKYKKFEHVTILTSQNVRDLLSLWLIGESVESIITLFRSFDENISTEDFHLFLNEGISFRFPWLVNSFFGIYRATVEDSDTISDEVNFTSTFLKFGVNSKTAALLMAMGLSNRKLAIAIGRLTGEIEPTALVKWLTEVSEEDLKRDGISSDEIREVMVIATKVSSTMGTLDLVSFPIKGIPYLDSRKEGSRTVNVGDVLRLTRDYANEFDPYAIKIFGENTELGFVPKELARKVSPEIDVFDHTFMARVIEKVPFNDWFKITVQLEKA